MAEKSSELIAAGDTENDFESSENLERLDRTADGETDVELKSDDPDATDETEEIRTQIEETRRGMSETIDAIQEKLSISNITEQVKEQVTEQLSSVYETAKDSVYGATLGKAGELFGKTGEFMKTIGNEINKSELPKVVGKNPLPFVLIGVGIAFLLVNRSSSSRNFKSYRYHPQTGRPANFESAHENQSNGGTFQAVGTAANSAYETVSGAAGSAYEGVSGAASSAYQGIGGFAGDARDKIGEYGAQTKDTYEHYIQENPLAVGAVALAVGAAVGLSIPSTRYEGQLMGEAHDKLFSKAEEAARDAIDKVKEVAGSLTEEAKNKITAK